MRIRNYLLLMAVALLGPVIVFSAIALDLMFESGRASALRGMHETARATALMVDRELYAAEAALKALSASPYLASRDYARFHAQAGAASRGPDTWTVLIDSDGSQLVNTVAPYGQPLERARALARIRPVLERGRTFVSDLHIGAYTGRPVVMLGLPVATPDGRRYVLATIFAARFFDSLIAQHPAPAQWVTGIIGGDGRFIARNLNAERLVGRPARPELVAASGAAREGRIRHNTLEGVDVYDVYTHSAVAGWTIACAAPVALVEAGARRAILVAFLGLLAAVVSALLATAFFTRRLAASIDGAVDAAQALERGEPVADAVSSVEEVRRLHGALQDAGRVLLAERASRLQAESERQRLLVSEQEARRIAEAQNEAKDQFLAMLGHEIRNPLSAIAGASGIIALEAEGNERVLRAREVLERQSGNLAHIVDDLLDVTRVTNGKIMLNAEYLDLALVSIACLEGLRAAGRCAGREITITSSETWVHADRTRLEQIINNLLVNAIKYTPEGGWIDVAVYHEGADAVLAVRDSGVGISPELLPKVFDLFVQGADTLARTQGGLGIGLTLVRQLVRLHGGEVVADSAGVGKGSRFTVRLARATPGGAPQPAPAPARAGPFRVLLIEDNADARLMLAMGLGMHGHTVHEAGNGPDGIDLALAKNPDAAVIDIGLPGMDGLEIAAALRADARTRHIRLVALTGYGQEADRQRALAAGFDEHLVKPANMEQLQRLLEARD